MPQFSRLLGRGHQWGLNFGYAEQPNPRGLADAFIIGKEFIGKENVALILGDNIFFGRGLGKIMQAASKKNNGATIFAYPVRDPERYGVVSFDEKGIANSIEEKPKNPKSNFAVPGMYFYDNNVVSLAENLEPSPRGEIEISDINKKYMKTNNYLLNYWGVALPG